MKKNKRKKSKEVNERVKEVYAVFWIDAASYNGEKLKENPVGQCHQVTIGMLMDEPAKDDHGIEFIRLVHNNDGGYHQDWTEIPTSLIVMKYKVGEVLI